jgi:hypothetical protein
MTAEAKEKEMLALKDQTLLGMDYASWNMGMWPSGAL